VSNISFKLLIVSLITCFVALNAYSQESLQLDSFKAPRSLDFLPSPPNDNSLAFLNDKATSEAALNGSKDSNIYKQAILDTDYSADSLYENFSKSFGHKISKQDTPILYNLIELTTKVSSKATASAKKEYKRIRPFVYYGKQTCNPVEEKSLGRYASYPSGHTTEGWAIALLLAEINPDRQKQILKKGYQFGQSRIICGAHWPSDVQAGYIVGGSVFAALNASNQFRQLIVQARKEIS
jgi:acid phosphatase (class A)